MKQSHNAWEKAGILIAAATLGWSVMIAMVAVSWWAIGRKIDLSIAVVRNVQEVQTVEIEALSHRLDDALAVENQRLGRLEERIR